MTVNIFVFKITLKGTTDVKSHPVVMEMVTARLGAVYLVLGCRIWQIDEVDRHLQYRKKLIATACKDVGSRLRLGGHVLLRNIGTPLMFGVTSQR